jgi:hypothetical protein
MGEALKAMQDFIPDQGITGCGSFHRRLPTGGAAKGIPLKMCTSPELLVVPEMMPPSTFTLSNISWRLGLNENPKASKTNVATVITRTIIFLEIMSNFLFN